MGSTCNKDCTYNSEDTIFSKDNVSDCSSTSNLTLYTRKYSKVSLHTDSLYWLKDRNPVELYGDRVENWGKFGAVREFFRGTVCPDCCWCAFAIPSHKYMKNDQLYEFFEYVLSFFSQTASPSLRLWAERVPNDVYYEFVIKTFGIAKNHVNRREFWLVADKIFSHFETEKSTSDGEAGKFTISWHRKQTLIQPFYLNPDHSQTNHVTFKLFSSDKKVLLKEEIHDLVYHSILFFSSQQETFMTDLTEVWDVVHEVCRDILGGDQITEIDYHRFLKCATELRDVFRQLSLLQEERGSDQTDSRKSPGASLPSSADFRSDPGTSLSTEAET